MQGAKCIVSVSKGESYLLNFYNVSRVQDAKQKSENDTGDGKPLEKVGVGSKKFCSRTSNQFRGAAIHVDDIIVESYQKLVLDFVSTQTKNQLSMLEDWFFLRGVESVSTAQEESEEREERIDFHGWIQNVGTR